MQGKTICKALNEQLHRELSLSYFYLAGSLAFDGLKYPGMAHWMRVESSEKLGRAMTLLDYLRHCDVVPKLGEMAKPVVEGENPADIFKLTYKTEEENAAHWNRLSQLATEEREFPTLAFLQAHWSKRLLILHELRVLRDRISYGKGADCLLLLDFELAKRPCECAKHCFCGA